MLGTFIPFSFNFPLFVWRKLEQLKLNERNVNEEMNRKTREEVEILNQIELIGVENLVSVFRISLALRSEELP